MKENRDEYSHIDCSTDAEILIFLELSLLPVVNEVSASVDTENYNNYCDWFFCDKEQNAKQEHINKTIYRRCTETNLISCI